MHTILEIINLSTEFLSKKEVESPRINAELLLAHVLKCKRLDLYLKFDQPLKEDELNIYREFLKRRGKREPLQYIVGNVEFYGLEFIVNPSVLIPRPETEILVETVIENSNKELHLKILDIGTGSGNIAISISKNLINATVWGIDTSDEALKVAEENSINNSVDERTSFAKKNILNGFQFDEKEFDIIVSNPPYISKNDYQNLMPELKNFEPSISLTDDNDGLTFYREISMKAKSILKTGGRIYFEVGKDQYKDVSSILSENNFVNIKVKTDYSNIERVVYGEMI